MLATSLAGQLKQKNHKQHKPFERWVTDKSLSGESREKVALQGFVPVGLIQVRQRPGNGASSVLTSAECGPINRIDSLEGA